MDVGAQDSSIFIVRWKTFHLSPYVRHTGVYIYIYIHIVYSVSSSAWRQWWNTDDGHVERLSLWMLFSTFRISLTSETFHLGQSGDLGKNVCEIFAIFARDQHQTWLAVTSEKLIGAETM